MKLQRNWKVHIIHHTHTDIGYTDSQSRIARFHVEFLDNVIEIARKIRNGDTSLSGFRWTSECFWSIEQWLKTRPPERHEELIRCIRDGVIALSGTYLHFTELPDAKLLRASFERAQKFVRQHGLTLDSALSADINGFGWGYSQALYDAGIQNLVTCVHACVGVAPIGRRQVPFFWETPGGQKILVWNGEHYNLGNVMGLCPGSSLNYTFADEMDALHLTMDTMPIAVKRLTRYLYQLEKDNYPYDFVPLHVSGATTDNAPPSEAAIRFVHRWNETYPGPVRLQMSSPSELCRCAREHSWPIPKYRGDWPDWWSDGFASTPSEVRLAREAMRGWRWLENFDKDLSANEAARIEQNLLLFFEHTFNHSESTKAPWDIRVKAVSGNKRAYACAAYDAMMDMRDAVFASHGERPNRAPQENERFVYKVLNPLDTPVTDLAELYLDNKDYEVLNIGAQLRELKTGALVDYQKKPAPRGMAFYVPVTLEAHGEALFELEEGMMTLRFSERAFGAVGADFVPDVEGAEAVPAEPGWIETPFLKLEISQEAGIVHLIDKESGADLLASNREHAPFVPIYEVTPAGGREEITGRKNVRGLGRNRKTENVQRSVGILRLVKVGKTGPAWTPVELDYEVEGMSLYSVSLMVWHSVARIDAAVRIHKASVWQPENVYLSLPFAVPGGELWLDKAGAPMRPWRDQIPDTLTDWFSIQEGFASCNSTMGLAVATPDAPLLQLGPLAYGRRKLMGHPHLDIREARPYSWTMTNWWGTNFEASLGGFFEFKYRIEFGKSLANPTQALRQCSLLNHGLKTFRALPPAE